MIGENFYCPCQKAQILICSSFEHPCINYSACFSIFKLKAFRYWVPACHEVVSYANVLNLVLKSPAYSSPLSLLLNRAGPTW